MKIGGGVITVDSATEGKAFFQEWNFVGSDHVEILSPVNFEIDRFTAMYLVTVLNFNAFRYGYGRKRAQFRLKDEKLLLPMDSRGEIDWLFIKKYICSLPYSINLENHV